MPSAELSRRVESVVGYPPLVEMDADQRREFHLALYDARTFEELPGKWRGLGPSDRVEGGVAFRRRP